MRALLLVALLAAMPLAGCTSDGEALRLDAAAIPFGTLLTYEVERGTANTTETFVVVPVAAGYDLLAHRVTDATLASPFLHVGRQLAPRDPQWSGFVQFPLEDGASYAASAAGRDVQVRVTAVGEHETPWGTQTRAMDLVAVNGDTAVARARVLEEPRVFSRIEIDAGEHEGQRWRLVDWSPAAGWNDIPRWRIGDWWSYEAVWQGVPFTPTMIYNANDTASGGSPVYVLNPQLNVDRPLARLFHSIRQSDLASQSGALNTLISTQWRWPLIDGARWMGSTTVGDRDVPYQATTRLTPGITLPDGTVTTGYVITARTENGTVVGRWDYVPIVQYFTTFEVRYPTNGTVRVAWNLTGFGSGFAGTIEVPQRQTLYQLELTSGPKEISDTFEVGDTPATIEVFGFAGWRAEAAAQSRVEVLGPDGQARLVRGSDAFNVTERRLQLAEFLDAAPGTWTLRANLSEGTSMFLQIVGHWGEERTVDYGRRA